MNLFEILTDTTDFCQSAAGYKIFGFIGHIINIIQIAIPVLIIVMGTIDLVKAVVAQKPDEMKKAQSILIKRLIIGVVIFFVPMIVKFLIGMVDGNNDNACIDCLNTPGQCMEKAETMSKNSGNTTDGGNNNDSSSIETGEPQTEEEAKDICKKCEEKGSTCATSLSGNKYCDDGTPYEE
ncbi:MAG: hypothetical protein IJO32_02215 [Bacilli bacterium]|nr:hypothetical protein [Bacilli bacterium]